MSLNGHILRAEFQSLKEQQARAYRATKRHFSAGPPRLIGFAARRKLDDPVD
ncbi:hypothetical protein [Stutzerimonas stutzeri]|uniref:Uncharacterized protein n=1 Tax=Stutzerimonas stutzeri TaxID=316 RepID=A0A6I6LMA2_STUST|nr:hypothetical protein [Stutzerimonas stutzeri]QGZ31724.1 hypothetical protein GQA94_17295 [Stutzerimonas stutzeri]